MADKETKLFTSGIHSLLDAEVIPDDASSSSKNFLTQDGRLKLIGGKELVGDAGGAGKLYGEIFGYKVDGSKVHWRKIDTKIQYNASGTWTDVVTGLTSGADYTFTNYSSLAGTFTFAFGIDGIYKFHNANPASFNSMYDSTKNFKGHAFIDKGRAILWRKDEDKTGLYGSHIDTQDSSVYTTVSGEATTSLTGTLAFKAGGATRNCFAVEITLTGSGEVYTDNYDGTLTGSLGGTGTINYISGAYTVTNSGVGTVNYQWEDSNANGVTDFTKSGTRLAGEGFVVPQDEGGSETLVVLIGPDGNYYSIKRNTSYQFIIDATDVNPSNNVFRRGLGVQSLRGAYSTSVGIVFINTSASEKPEMTLLKRNAIGDNLTPDVLFPQFDFSAYNYDDASVFSYNRYIVVACKSSDSTHNDTLLLCDISAKTVDVATYSGRTFSTDDTDLYMGSSIVESSYKLFSGFDDDGYAIDAFWKGKVDDMGSEYLKKYRKLRLRGLIDPDQGYKVFLDYDGAGEQLVGTIVGSGSYVDYSSPQTIGSNIIGEAQVGGETTETAFPYFAEIKLRKVPKFRTRQIKFVPTGIGYVDIAGMFESDIEIYANKIPKRFRQKQNVSLDGETVDQATPEN